jgi:hypothetical protein
MTEGDLRPWQVALMWAACLQFCAVYWVGFVVIVLAVIG